MRYRAFDVVIESDLELPELPPSEGEPLWRIVTGGAVDAPAFARYHTIESGEGRPWIHCGRDGDRYLLDYPDFGCFVVGPDRTIEVAVTGTPLETLRHLVIDQVLPMALAHHGALVLHASAVEWNGKAVAFAGRSGSGKSTLAAACVDRGAALISDDAVVLRGEPSAPVTFVSYAGVRLWSDSSAMYDSAAAPTYVAHYTDKRRVNIRASGVGGIPVSAIFALEAGDAVDIAMVAPRDALMLLAANTYRLDTVDPAALRREFTALQQLVAAFPVRRLRYPRRYEALDEAVGAIRSFCG